MPTVQELRRAFYRAVCGCFFPNDGVAADAPAPVESPVGASAGEIAGDAIQEAVAAPILGHPPFTAVHDRFLEIRGYYKGAVKSFNKIYDLPDEDDPKKEKKEKRNTNAIESRRLESEQEYDEMFKTTPLVEIGRHIFENDVRNGNCANMACVAAYMLRDRFPDAAIHYVALKPPGDHEFIVVGEAPPEADINSWRSQPATETYVVDIWLGICCSVPDYPGEIVDKLDQWAKDKKLVLTVDPFSRQWVPNIPNSEAYLTALLKAKMGIRNADRVWTY